MYIYVKLYSLFQEEKEKLPAGAIKTERERVGEKERDGRAIIRHKRVTLSSHIRCNEQWPLVGEKSE